MAVDRVKVEGQMIRIKIETENPEFRPLEPSLEPMKPLIKSEDPNNETLEDADEEMEQDEPAEEEPGEEEDSNATTLGSGQRKEVVIFSTKTRRWFRENYSLLSVQNSFLTREEIASEYAKAHPEAKPLTIMLVGKIVKFVWGKKVKSTRRRVHLSADGTSIRKCGYLNLVRRSDVQEPSNLSKSILILPRTELFYPGWSMECLPNPVGIRYRKVIQQFYVDRHAAIVEVYFSLYKDDGVDGNIKSGNDGDDCNNGSNDVSGKVCNDGNGSVNVGSDGSRNGSVNAGSNGSCSGSVNAGSNGSGSVNAGSNGSCNGRVNFGSNGSGNASNSNNINITEQVYKLRASILCNGRVISAEELELWDNKSIPTLKNVHFLLDVIGSSGICFGSDMPESWSGECLKPKEKIVVVHKCFDDLISNRGQRKLMSVDCKILPTTTGEYYCNNCANVKKVASRRESRKVKTTGNKNQIYRNNIFMTRKELEDKLRNTRNELQKAKNKVKKLEKKLSEVNETDSEDSNSSSTSDHESSANESSANESSAHED